MNSYHNGQSKHNNKIVIEHQVNTQKLAYSFLNNWYWFIIVGVIGLALSYVYSKKTKDKFDVNASLVVNDEDRSLDMSSLFNTSVVSNSSTITEHLGILKSFNINFQTLQNLDWRITGYTEDFFRTYDVYRNLPFIIETDADSLNINEVPVYIYPETDNTYRIEIDAAINIDGVEQTITVSKSMKYDEYFTNNFFRFKVNKSPSYGNFLESGRNFFFKFNDIHALTNRYIENLRVTYSEEESNILHLNLTDEHIKRTVDYLNQLCIVYIQYGLNEKNQSSENTIQFIDTQLSGVVDSLQVAGQNFTDFRSKNRIVDLSQEASMVVDKLEEIEREESMAKVRLEYYQNLGGYLNDAGQMEQVIAPSVVGITDPTLNAMVLKLSELYSRKNSLSIVVEPENPTLQAIDSEIKYVRESLEENLKNLISNAQVQLNAISKRKAEINAQLSKMPRQEQDLVNIRRQFDLNNELYTFLLQKRAEAAIKKASNNPDVKILDLALAERATPVGLNNLLIYLLGIFASMAVPALVIFLKNYFDNSFDNKIELESETHLPIIAEVLFFEEGKSSKEIPTLNYPGSGVSESFRNLRTNLSFLTTGKRKVISIHSTGPGEGKTFVSLNLAITLANNNRKVLLIGADMRKPRLQNYIKSKAERGLSTYLIGKNNVKEVLSRTNINNLDIILSGPVPPNPAELLESVRFRKLVEDGREIYDYVIIDNAPVPVVTDGLIVGSYSDVNLFVIRLNHSRRENLKYIEQVAREGNLKHVSLVVNGVKAKKFGYYRMYKEGGYYRSTKKKEKKLYQELIDES